MKLKRINPKRRPGIRLIFCLLYCYGLGFINRMTGWGGFTDCLLSGKYLLFAWFFLWIIWSKLCEILSLHVKLLESNLSRLRSKSGNGSPTWNEQLLDAFSCASSVGNKIWTWRKTGRILWRMYILLVVFGGLWYCLHQLSETQVI